MISKINLKRSRLLGFLTFLVICSNAQSYQKNESGVTVSFDSIKLDITFYSPSIARIVKSLPGKEFNKTSLSVIKSPQKTAFSLKKQGDVLTLKTEKINIAVNLKTGNLSFYSTNGKTLLSEKEGSTQFTPFNDAGNNTYTVFQAYQLDPDEAIYGLGQQQRGKMVQRNLTLNMIQGNTDDYITFFQSVKGYGLFWDNYSPTQFVDKPESTSFKSDVGDCIDYYFMYGGNADGVIANMRDLT